MNTSRMTVKGEWPATTGDKTTKYGKVNNKVHADEYKHEADNNRGCHKYKCHNKNEKKEKRRERERERKSIQLISMTQLETIRYMFLPWQW